MKFLSKEICEKLVELGCKSENGKGYYKHFGYEVPAFYPYDFLSSEDYAISNCKKLSPKWRRFRLDLLWAKDQVAFLEEAVRGK